MRKSHGLGVFASAALVVLFLGGCTGAAAPTRSGTPTPGAGAIDGEQAFNLDPSSKRCDPARATEYGVAPAGLPEHWPSDVPVIPGPCFAAFEQPDSMGGYAIELSIAVTGTNIDFDNYPPWQTANEWLVDAGMEAAFADTDIAGSRESLYREGLVTASTGDEFYH